MSDQAPLTNEQLDAAKEQLVVKFPRVERLPVDPPIAGQNVGAFSFKLLPKPVNGVYGFLKFRGAFSSMPEFEAHAQNIIRNVDSKHTIWPYSQGRWMPITTNEDFVQETLEVGKNGELESIFNDRETDEQKQAAANVKEIKSRERKLMEQVRNTKHDDDSIEYYAQKVMQMQQLESWLEMMRKRKRDFLKSLKSAREDISRLESLHPDYLEQVDDVICKIKEDIGLDPNAPLDRPSLSVA